MMYKNFLGVQKKFEDIDHQHISNLYWFHKIINQNTPDINFKTLIDEKFGGIIMSYRPHDPLIKFVDFNAEIKYLDARRYLLWNEDKTKADIKFEGEIIGVYESKSYIRNRKILELIND